MGQEPWPALWSFSPCHSWSRRVTAEAHSKWQLKSGCLQPQESGSWSKVDVGTVRGPLPSPSFRRAWQDWWPQGTKPGQSKDFQAQGLAICHLTNVTFIPLVKDHLYSSGSFLQDLGILGTSKARTLVKGRQQICFRFWEARNVKSYVIVTQIIQPMIPHSHSLFTDYQALDPAMAGACHGFCLSQPVTNSSDRL